MLASSRPAAFIAFLLTFTGLSRAVAQEATPPTHSSWPKYCANLEMTGVAPDAGTLNRNTVATLTKVWQTQLGGSIASSPTVVDTRLYIGDWGGHESLIDATTVEVLTDSSLGMTVMPSAIRHRSASRRRPRSTAIRSISPAAMARSTRSML